MLQQPLGYGYKSCDCARCSPRDSEYSIQFSVVDPVKTKVHQAPTEPCCDPTVRSRRRWRALPGLTSLCSKGTRSPSCVEAPEPTLRFSEISPVCGIRLSLP